MTRSQWTLSDVLLRATSLAPDGEIATKREDGEWHQYTYQDAYERVCQLAHALDELGIGAGKRVGTVAANHDRHYELYFAVPGSGRSLHTINHRLPDEHFEYVVEDAEDAVLFVDPQFIERVECHRDAFEDVSAFVVLDDEVPDTALEPVTDYESLLEGRPTEYEWPSLDPETECGLCHTSGTTGIPKGVQHTHGMLVRACNMMLQTDTVAVSGSDVVFPIVPMFHGYAWAYPYVATIAGSKLVLADSHTSPEALTSVIEREGVTIASAVPTIWLDVAAYLDESGKSIAGLERIQSGGSAVPESLIRRYDDAFDVEMIQAWGMTETAPFATISRAPSGLEADCGEIDLYASRAKAGRPVPGISVRVRDEDGESAPRDGETVGELQVRGEWVIDSYYERPDADADGFTCDGWLRTGDVATWDKRGFVDVVDRKKDIIKSGGEWISSLELESELMRNDAVAEAAVIAVDHDIWQERPFAFVVTERDRTVDAETLNAHLRERFPKWWLPDEYEFVDALPRTSTEKFDKQQLSKRLDS
ncbi:long-chain-fatty-acid--CoA ligase [Halobellus limi]|uniref:Fatty-acid--CoA ligase n=1 Tax=Halobellus limi TaxID=699433 RepID=A0A1H6BRD2_9EURY|nr:long-chain-fatty-acid--CoA ligase [Halobellus limi]QCC49372.1 fatty-acid--CoA ligase [Halobellus limi]SEG63025.1 fatty-acyl-CoA synthase [Halobellus limi]